MTVEVIDIVIRESGGERAAKQIRKVGSQAKQTSSSLDLMKRSIGALTGALAIDTLIRYADAFTTIQNRLRLVTDSTSQLVRVQNELFAIANRSQSQISTTAELYNRLANASEDFFVSEKRLLGIVELVNKSLLISGTGLQTSQAAITQFSQALSSGQLRGEEFNSVVEQAPRLARALADGLGVTIGKLRELAFSGGLTTEKILRAIESQSSKINEEAKSIVPTIGRSFAQVQNEFTKFVAIFDKTFEVSKNVSEILTEISEKLPSLAVAGVTAINTVRAVFKTWSDDLPAVGSSIEALGLNMEGIKVAASETVSFIANAVAQFPANIKTVIDIAVIEIVGVVEKIKSVFQDTIDFIKITVNNIKGFANQLAFNFLPNDSSAAAVDQAISENQQIRSQQQERRRSEQASADARSRTASEIMAENESRRQNLTNSYESNFNQLQNNANRRLREAGLPSPDGTGGNVIDPNTVTYDQVYRASLKNQNTGNSFSDSDFRTVQFVLPNGDKVKMQGSAGSVDRLTSNISNQSLKAGRR